MPDSTPSSTAPNPASSRGRFDAVVHANRAICREHHVLTVRLPAFPATQPGQFIQIGCAPPADAIAPAQRDGSELIWSPTQPPTLHQIDLCERSALLRRPFSLSGRRDDQQGVHLEIIHRVVGVGTAWLAQLKPGDRVDLIGPLGGPFLLPANKKNAILVGGGVGLPPMFYLAEHLAAQGWSAIACVGALTADLLAVDLTAEPDQAGAPTLCDTRFAQAGVPLAVTSDDGTVGARGRVTLAVDRALASLSPDQRRQTVIYTCGPEPMMHAVANLAQQADVDCQVCLEQAMACGMGTCQSCIVRIEADPDANPQPHGCTSDGRPWRYRLACTDGPVFDARKVVW